MRRPDHARDRRTSPGRPRRRDLLQPPLDLASAGGLRRQVAGGDHHLAAAAFDRREFARASDTYAAVLDQARELGDPTLLRTMSLNLALARIEQAETVGVQALLAGALAHCAAMHNWAVASFPTIGPALLANLRGQPRRAARLIGASKVLRAIGNIPLPAAQAPFAARAIAMTQAALDEATYTALTDEGRRWTIQCLLDAAHEAW